MTATLHHTIARGWNEKYDTGFFCYTQICRGLLSNQKMQVLKSWMEVCDWLHSVLGFGRCSIFMYSPPNSTNPHNSIQLSSLLKENVCLSKHYFSRHTFLWILILYIPLLLWKKYYLYEEDIGVDRVKPWIWVRFDLGFPIPSSGLWILDLGLRFGTGLGINKKRIYLLPKTVNFWMGVGCWREGRFISETVIDLSRLHILDLAA